MTETTLEMIQALTPKQTAEVLQVSVRTLALWRQQGTGPDYFMAGRLPRYLAKDIAHWQARRIVAKMRPSDRRRDGRKARDA